MRIHQAHVGVHFFKEAFLKKFELKNYTDPCKPAIFFGVYRAHQNILLNHKSTAVVVWTGTDVIHMKKNPIFLRRVRENRRIYHIAISSFIETDLRLLGIPFISLPVIPNSNLEFKQEPLGKAVYMYTSAKAPQIYGDDILNEIKKKLPDIKFITATAHTYSREQLKEIYKKCFLGLRLTKHDGLSNTVVELGLMGRKVIWNGNTPNAIPYTGVPDIIRKIRKIQTEAQDLELSKKVSDYINIGTDWLDTDFYCKNKDMYNASVIINTYQNTKEHLIQAIESYLNQKDVNIQLIISTVKGDPAVKIAEQYDLYCCVSDQPGIYPQLNKALSLIRNDWFAYASGNDVAYPNKMFDEIDHCVKANKMVCYSGFDYANADLKVYATKIFHDYNYERHLNGNFVNDCATIHKSLIDKYAPFDLKWGNHAYYDFWLRIYEKEGNVFVHNPNPTWIYRVSNKSSHVIRSKDAEKKEANRRLKIKMIQSHAERS